VCIVDRTFRRGAAWTRSPKRSRFGGRGPLTSRSVAQTVSHSQVGRSTSDDWSQFTNDTTLSWR